MENELTFEQKLDELNDFINHKIEELFPGSKSEALWLGKYNNGSGDRVTIEDGSNFCWCIEHIYDMSEEAEEE